MSQFLPLLGGETYFFQFFFISLPIWKKYVNSNKVFVFSRFVAALSLVLRITASCKGKYLLNHAFQTVFPGFFSISSTSDGRNLFLPGRFKPGFNPFSSTRRKNQPGPNTTYHLYRSQWLKFTKRPNPNSLTLTHFNNNWLQLYNYMNETFFTYPMNAWGVKGVSYRRFQRCQMSDCTLGVSLTFTDPICGSNPGTVHIEWN